MKIEIELSELESLRKDLLYEKERNQKLFDKLKELNEHKLKQSAVRLAYHLTDCYLKAIFTKLGFEETNSGLEINGNLEHWIGKDWYNNEDRIDLKIGVTIINEFRMALLKIGVLPKKEDSFDYDLINKD